MQATSSRAGRRWTYWVDPASAHVQQIDKDGKNEVDLAIGGTAYRPTGLAVDAPPVY